MENRNSKQADFLSAQVCRRQMGPLTSVGKIRELCFCHVSREPQPWRFTGPGGRGREAGGQCDLIRGMTPMQRPQQGQQLRPLIAMQRTHLGSEVAGCRARGGECSLVDEPFGFISFCLCLGSYKSFPHPADPPKSQVLKKKKRKRKKAQESIYQSSHMRRMGL